MNPFGSHSEHRQFIYCLFYISIMRVYCSGEESEHVERERCSRVHLDAVTSDNVGNMYAFRGEI